MNFDVVVVEKIRKLHSHTQLVLCCFTSSLFTTVLSSAVCFWCPGLCEVLLYAARLEARSGMRGTDVFLGNSKFMKNLISYCEDR